MDDQASLDAIDWAVRKVDLRCAVRVFLVANKRLQPEIVFTRDYRASHEAEARTADALVTALDRCLEQILSAVEQDLGKVL